MNQESESPDSKLKGKLSRIASGISQPEKLKNLVVIPLASQTASSKFWAVVAATLGILLWICVVELTTLGNRFLVQKYWPSDSSSDPPERKYETNGYLMVTSNGGLNQMRTGICDMVAIARYMNVTFIVPALDRTSFWHDYMSFEDLFDIDLFMASLKDEVQILKELPQEEKKRSETEPLYSTNPLPWSRMNYYYETVLPQIKEHKVLHFNQTEARLANNGIPEEVQRLRCRVCYEALRFTTPLQKMGRKIVYMLQRKGPFLVLHLRYEKDMLSFTGCTVGLSHNETVELINFRKDFPWWKTSADPVKKRKMGLCPLTPDETALALQALGIDRNIQIYIASGNIYGGESRLAKLAEAYPNLVKKENLLEPEDLRPFWNHSNKMAALDYMVSMESDIFVPTYEGNMASMVEGHRRYLGYKTTIKLNKRLLVSLIDQYKTGRLSWDEFCFIFREAHKEHMGKPTQRVKNPKQPRYEDYFYSNPQECLPQ